MASAPPPPAQAQQPTLFNPASYVRRPGFGRIGQPTKVNTNYYELTALPQHTIAQYDVTIEPDVPIALNRVIFQHFEDTNRGNWNGQLLAFDGRKIAFSSKPLPFGDATRQEITLPEREPRSSRRPPRTFTLTIRKVTEINMHEVAQYLQGRCKISPQIYSGIMAIDIVMRHLPASKFITAGRSFYIDESLASPLPGGLVARFGVYQSARPTANRMLVNVDISATTFYAHGPLLPLAAQVMNKRSPDQLHNGVSPHDLARLESFIKGLYFRVVHRGPGKPRYKAARLTKTDAFKTYFPVGDSGQQQSVADYFLQKYQVRLNFPNLPCIEVKKHMYFPLEMCEIVENQRNIRRLNPEQTDAMIRFTTHRPDKRLNMIRDGVRSLNFRQNHYMNNFGLRVDDSRPLMINSRVLPTPRVRYHPTSREAVVTPRDGTWNLRDKRVYQGASLASWAVMSFADRVGRSQVETFIRELCKVCQNTGMNVVAQQPPIHPFNRQSNVEQGMRNVYMDAEKKFRAPPQLILCIVPDSTVPLYAEIKRVSETIFGIPTQCVVAKHTMRPNVQYCANVCLKMNAKLGGVNSVLPNDQLPFINEKPTIVLGADVTHPAPGDQTRPSIATIVGSIDVNLARFTSATRVQTARTEIINDMRDMIMDILKSFYRNTTYKPARILMYRDGVSEGEREKILELEVKAVKEACMALEPNYRPTLTYVTVQKRHHTRFFPTRREASDRSGNCLPGTVVDSEITSPYEFDFFLQSHAGIQGTSRPAHYQVLYDENRFTPDALQELTYRMCYLYARCTRAVGVVPPIYYADILAARARYHASGDNFSDTVSQLSDSSGLTYKSVHERLRDCMFYM